MGHLRTACVLEPMLVSRPGAGQGVWSAERPRRAPVRFAGSSPLATQDHEVWPHWHSSPFLLCCGFSRPDLPASCSAHLRPQGEHGTPQSCSEWAWDLGALWMPTAAQRQPLVSSSLNSKPGHKTWSEVVLPVTPSGALAARLCGPRCVRVTPFLCPAVAFPLRRVVQPSPCQS